MWKNTRRPAGPGPCFAAQRMDFESLLSFQDLLIGVLLGCLLSVMTGSFWSSSPSRAGEQQDGAVVLRCSMGQSDTAPPDEQHNHAAYSYEPLPPEEMAAVAKGFHRVMLGRRSVRFFSQDAVPRAVVEDCIRTAGTAPSGAHCQPWKFVSLQRRVQPQRHPHVAWRAAVLRPGAAVAAIVAELY